MTALLESAYRGLIKFRKLNVNQYHKMIEQGILPEDHTVELLDGMLVQKNRSAAGQEARSIGVRHRACQDAILDYKNEARRIGCFLSINCPVVIPPDNEPEPDVAIIHGDRTQYSRRHPSPQDLACLVEIADSSINQDKTKKLALYATALIPHYVIVDLTEDQIISYTDPDVKTATYRGRDVLRGDDVLQVVGKTGTLMSVKVSTLFPPR